MTFWDAFVKAFEWVSNRITRILGLAQGTIAVLSGMAGIIPDKQLKYWLAVSAVLTFWRGQATGKTYTQAKAVLASVPTIQPESSKSVNP